MSQINTRLGFMKLHLFVLNFKKFMFTLIYTYSGDGRETLLKGFCLYLLQSNTYVSVKEGDNSNY